MGHQVNFFVMPADLPDLETAMRATGDVCFIADKSPTCELVELDTIAFGPPTEPRLRTCFIVQRKDIASVSTASSRLRATGSSRALNLRSLSSAPACSAAQD